MLLVMLGSGTPTPPVPDPWNQMIAEVQQVATDVYMLSTHIANIVTTLQEMQSARNQ